MIRIFRARLEKLRQYRLKSFKEWRRSALCKWVSYDHSCPLRLMNFFMPRFYFTKTTFFFLSIQFSVDSTPSSSFLAYFIFVTLVSIISFPLSLAFAQWSAFIVRQFNGRRGLQTDTVLKFQVNPKFFSPLVALISFKFCRRCCQPFVSTFCECF